MILPRHAEFWLTPYLKYQLRRAVNPAKPKHAWIFVADHFESLGRSRSAGEALRKVAAWSERWPRGADDAPRDATGRRPQYAFFYPGRNTGGLGCYADFTMPSPPSTTQGALSSKSTGARITAIIGRSWSPGA
jgi:hypothetical protein